MAEQTGPITNRTCTTPDTAYFLTAAGALPFVAGAAVALLGNDMDCSWACQLVRYYGAVILSFMGGIHWGLAMGPTGTTPPNQSRRLMLSVVPALIGWLALLLSPPAGLAVLALAFVILLVFDLKATQIGYAPSWYPRLRIPVTSVVVLSLSVSLFGMISRHV